MRQSCRSSHTRINTAHTTGRYIQPASASVRLCSGVRSPAPTSHPAVARARCAVMQPRRTATMASAGARLQQSVYTTEVSLQLSTEYLAAGQQRNANIGCCIAATAPQPPLSCLQPTPSTRHVLKQRYTVRDDVYLLAAPTAHGLPRQRTCPMTNAAKPVMKRRDALDFRLSGRCYLTLGQYISTEYSGARAFVRHSGDRSTRKHRAGFNVWPLGRQAYDAPCPAPRQCRSLVDIRAHLRRVFLVSANDRLGICTNGCVDR